MGLKSSTGSASLCFVGDLSLAGRVGKRIENVAGFDPLSPVDDLIHAHDLAVANLENPYSECIRGKVGQAHILSSPPRHINIIARAGFGLVTLANNHILDLSAEGLRDTIEALDRRGILHTGAGSNLESARQPAIISVRSIEFGFLAYAMKGAHSATAMQPGAAYIEPALIHHDVIKLKQQVDHVIVSLHAGFEFIDYPDPRFRSLFMSLIEAGASCVIGHHPHVLNGVERYKGGVAAYSLGNFLFDTEVMDLSTPRTSESIMLSCSFDKRSVLDCKSLPIIIRPELDVALADGERGALIVDRLEALGKTLRSASYPDVYHDQVRALWPKINFAVNWRILKTQGLRAMLIRLPRLKLIYVELALRYLVSLVLKKR